MTNDNDDYKMENHQFVFWKAIGKHYCVKCGLVATTNDFSTWCSKMGCMNSLHPQYQKQRLKFTKMFKNQ